MLPPYFFCTPFLIRFGVFLAKATQCIHYCLSRIVQVEYQGQTWNMRIVERKLLIDTSYCILHRLELKYLLCTIFAQCSSSSSLTLKKWELITWNLYRSSRSSYELLLSNTVDECLQRLIAKKIFKLKIEAHPVNVGHYMAFKHCISFVTYLAAIFGCDQFRITPDSVSKLLCTAIWNSCAVIFKYEQTPFPRTVYWFRPAALHRIWLGTCCFVPMSYFYSQINDW